MSRPIDGFKKTERTHEENQERAYIAASRRSDRSLEARLESARRASEIHKRRTGKALRVTEADVQNEEMYEEEDDLPASFAYGLGSSSFELRLRMQAYWEQQFALRNAMSLAASGANLNLANPQPPFSLRDYYQRFAQQYPLSMDSNHYLFPPQPMNFQQGSPAPPANPMTTSSPSMNSPASTSPPSKSPVVASNRHSSVSSAPYSVSNSQRNRRASSTVQPTEHLTIQQRRHNSIAAPQTIKAEPTFLSSPPLEQYTAQPFPSSPMYPFTTQLPTHMQQYHLPDFVAPALSIEQTPVPEIKSDSTNMDLFSNNEWSNFIIPNESSKLTPYDDTTNWDDYLDNDANWLLNSQVEPES